MSILSLIRKSIFKVNFAIYRIVLYILFNTDHGIYMKHYISFLKRIGVNVYGKPNYINYYVKFDSTDNYALIELNDHCVITGNTLILTHDYSLSHASLYCGQEEQSLKKAKVVIGENAFVGANCIILPGCRIGKNSIVGAGSVVTKDVPDNTIVAGNPARKIKTIEEYIHL